MQRVAILGSTGIIGRLTLDVISRHKDEFEIFALTANQSVNELAKQCIKWQPKYAVLATKQSAKTLQATLKQASCPTKVLFGEKALCDVVTDDACESVMAAIVGAAGLLPTLAAAKAGKKILLANKEALVMAGQVFMQTVQENGATLIPVDSEHHAIFECLVSNGRDFTDKHALEKIILTASGGPFLRRSSKTFKFITPAEATSHPRWVMGPKISVDSATMMNKALEVIEAYHLFNLNIDQIDVIIHPESIIHSMVVYKDGTVRALLSEPDMRVPIAHALSFPSRITSGAKTLDLLSLRTLSFEKPDILRFPALQLGYEAIKAGPYATVVLNAANEMAVEAFLAGHLPFTSIGEVVRKTLDESRVSSSLDTLDAILACDRQARDLAYQKIMDVL